MGRLSTVHALPPTVRAEIDRQLLLPTGQQEVRSWLTQQGYAISSSSFSRYAKKLLDGSEDLRLLATGGQPLGSVLADLVATADPQVAELLSDLVSLQVRQLAVLQKLQGRLREIRREADARAWVEGRQQ
jgi:hypothetical protein